MPQRGGMGEGGVSCASCYFRQELLCALKTDTVCPTYRASTGRRLEQPRQARLVALPVVGTAAATATMEPAAMAVAGGARHTHLPLHPATTDAAPAAEVSQPAPFASSAPESTFSLRELCRDEPDPAATAGDLVAAAATELRVAAASIDLGNECVVEIEPQAATSTSLAGPVSMLDRGAGRSAAGAGHEDRASRIARRIAQRYPNSIAGS